MTKVKFCGIKDPKTLKLCLKMNVNCLGFVFYKKSIRNISIDKSIKLFLETPPFILKVGVFSNPDFYLIKKITRNLNLDLIQYSGNESIKFCEKIYTFNRLPWIKVNKINFYTKKLEKKINNSKRNLFYFDKKDSKPGGSGKSIIIKVSSFNNKKIVLSGGISYKNVFNLILKTKPYFVDVSSGIEKKGKKNKILMKKFLREVNLANFFNNET